MPQPQILRPESRPVFHRMQLIVEAIGWNVFCSFAYPVALSPFI